MKRLLIAAILAAGAVFATGLAGPALAASIETANLPAPTAQQSSVRPGPRVRVKRTSRRVAKQSLTAKRRRAIGEGAPEVKSTGIDEGGTTAPAVLRQLRVVMRAIRNHDERKSEGVSGTRVRALALIDSRPGLQVGAFAQELGVHQSTASNLLEQLARQSLVEKRRNSGDQRSVSLYATARAQAMLKRETPAHAVQEALKRLPPSKLAALQEQLADLIRALPPGRIVSV